jgi:hypothetical protein
MLVVWKWGTPSPSSFPIKSQVFIVNPRFFGQAIRKELISFMADGVSKVGVYQFGVHYVGIPVKTWGF